MESIRDKISGFFHDPLESEIGLLIYRYTDITNTGENLDGYMQICNLINLSTDGPIQAIRALNKRFQEGSTENIAICYYTLSLLDVCVKNCGYRFLLVLAKKNRLEYFTRCVLPPTNTNIPVKIQDKILSLIQNWAIAFKNQVDLMAFSDVYAELVEKGVKFPIPNANDIELLTKDNMLVTGNSRLQPSSPKTSTFGRGKPANVKADNTSEEIRTSILTNLQYTIRCINSFSEMLSSVADTPFTHVPVETRNEITNSAAQVQKQQNQLIQMIQHWQTMLSDSSTSTTISNDGVDPTLVELISANDSALECLRIFANLTATHSLPPTEISPPTDLQSTRPQANASMGPTCTSLDMIKKKVYADLAAVTPEVTHLSALLSEQLCLQPNQQCVQTFNKIKELVSVLHCRQKLLLNTISTWESAISSSTASSDDLDAVTSELLSVNDLILDAFKNYHRLENSINSTQQKQIDSGNQLQQNGLNPTAPMTPDVSKNLVSGDSNTLLSSSKVEFSAPFMKTTPYASEVAILSQVDNSPADDVSLIQLSESNLISGVAPGNSSCLENTENNNVQSISSSEIQQTKDSKLHPPLRDVELLDSNL